MAEEESSEEEDEEEGHFEVKHQKLHWRSIKTGIIKCTLREHLHVHDYSSQQCHNPKLDLCMKP